MMGSIRGRVVTPDGMAAIFVALLPIVYFFPAIFGSIILAPDDAILFGLPLRVAAAQMLRHGQLPLWNPYLFSGMPLFASAQGGVLFPLNWFFLILGPRAAMNIAVLVAYSGAGLGAYLYARRAGANITGGIVTALVWQSSGFLVAQIGHTNMIHVAALLPWLLWSIDRYGASGAHGRGVLVAIFVALQVFAGHQQTLVYSLLLAAAYAIVIAFDRTDLAQRRAYLCSLALIGVGLLIGAVQILPTIELSRESLRSSATYDFFSSFSLPPSFLLTFFAPFLLGGGDGSLFRAPYLGEAFYAEYIGYVGIAALALAAIAPFVRRDRATKFWACAALIALALALGRFLPFDLYRLIYHIPVLNLFRVPARHLMILDFALAVLAGRAVTYLPQVAQARRVAIVVAAGFVVILLTWAAVTVWRPADFRLGRIGPVSLLRAPELFFPLFITAGSVWILLRFALEKRFARAALIGFIFADLCLWGQFSGWRAGSPRSDDAIFGPPAAVQLLQKRESGEGGKFRLLTLDKPFLDTITQHAVPALPFDISFQPNTYMLHRMENAAGYDGFGLARYSRLAGDMKPWGEFRDPAQSIGVSRELDILNVRYLIAPVRQPEAPQVLAAPAILGGFAFSEGDLGLPSLAGGERFDFVIPSASANRVALVTNLVWSATLPDGTPAATLTLFSEDGRSWRFDLRVGVDSSEWAYDRPDIRSGIRHSRAPIAYSYPVEDKTGNYGGHTFITSFALPERAVIAGGSIAARPAEGAPTFGFNFLRLSLIDDSNGGTTPLRREWVDATPVRGAEEPTHATAGWSLVSRTPSLALYENRDALPRVWLAGEVRPVSDDAKIEVIRTGKLPDGSPWDPRRTVLLDEPLKDGPLPPVPPENQRAQIVRYRPNEVEVSTASTAASVLILSDNHYPGWTVKVDGQSARLLRADYNLRGVALTAGSHTVRFAYRPRSVYYGTLLSLFSAAALGAWCWYGRRASAPAAEA